MIRTDESVFAKITAFLATIEISVQLTTVADETFLPGILIDQGCLKVDRTQLLYPGDLLHEAGHIAVTMPDERSFLGGNITEGNPQKDGDELAVLLWTYAACRYLNLDPAVVFHPDGYKGQSDWLINCFDTGQYLGLPLLVWMGMTSTEDFPNMKRWLRT